MGSVCGGGGAAGLAAGMMLSASMLLLFEGMESSEHEVRSLWHPHLVGCIGGVAFIFASKRWLGHHEHLKFSGMEGTRVCLRLQMPALSGAA
jgi:zinc transporter ZupT